MGISGSQPAYTDAMGGVMRGSSSRGNVHSRKVFVKIAGVQYPNGAAQVDNETLAITEVDGETPNTCTFQMRGVTPSDGQDVIITQGSINNLDRLFAGTILADATGYVGTPSNTRDQVSVIDYTWQLTRRSITKRWTNVSATTIAKEIIAAAPGFTSLRVEGGLPALDEFTVTDKPLNTALNNLANRIGARWKATYLKDVRFGITAGAETDPTTITAASALSTQLNSLHITRDLSQVITRQPVEGGGVGPLAEVTPGETIMPLEAVAWYSPGGGLVRSGPQIISYTGLIVGGGGGLVGPGATPSAGVVVFPTPGAGVQSGVHDYAVTFVTASGESLVGPRTTVTVGLTPPPSTAPTPGTPTVGAGLNAGAHDYLVTFVTSAGETTNGPASLQVTTLGITTPATPVVAFNGPNNFGAGAPGTFRAVGETVAYKIAYSTGVLSTDHSSETLPSGAASTTTIACSSNPAKSSVIGVTVANSLSPAVTWIRVYSSFNGSTYRFTGALANNSAGGTQEFDDFGGDISSGDQPSTTDISRNQVPLTGIPIGGSGVTSRKLYRRFNGTGTFKLVTTIADNTTTTYTDSTANASLGAAAPSSNTATANQVAVSSIPIGPATVTARKLYRTENALSSLKLLTTISDNTTTTYTDSTADASLGAAEPASDTSGLTQPSGQVLAGSTSVPMAGTGAMPSAGWAVIGNGQQVIRYTGVTATQLTGIPAAGIGAIAASIAYNSTITAAPALIGIPASGAGSILFTIKRGDPVNLRVVEEDAAAQTAIAALMGGGDDGVIEGTVITDERISETEARARGRAVIDQRKSLDVAVSLVGHDRNYRAGRTLGVGISAPSLTASLRITQVTITHFLPARWPTRAGTASSRRFTLEDLLRVARLASEIN